MTEERRFVAKIAAARARHRERHRPTGFQFALADRIGFLPSAVWDELTASGSLFLGRSYLTALENAPPPNLSCRYALIFRDSSPVAAVAMQVVELSTKDLKRSPDPSPSSRVLPAGTGVGLLRTRVLVCGNLLSWGNHGVCFAVGEDPAQLWPAVAEVLYRVRRAERLSGQTNLVLVKDLDPASRVGIESLERFSYRPFETDPNMVLAIPEDCRSYDDYLGLLTAKYRKGVLRMFEQFNATGCVIEPAEDLSPIAATLDRLYREINDQAKVRLVTASPDYLPALSRWLGDRFRCLLAKQGQDIVGFVTVLRDGDEAVGYLIGFDRERNQAAPIYLRLMHVVIEQATAWGCRTISFGRTALEPKARLGARPVELSCWVRHRVPLVNLLVRRLLGVVPHDEPPDRNALRSS